MRLGTLEGLRAAALVGGLAGAMAVTLPSWAGGQTIPQSETCIRCHLDLDDEALARPARDYEQDVHAEVGFSCLDCHGPDALDPGAAPDPSTGFLAKPTRRNVAAMCGGCHSNGGFMRQFDPAFRIDQEAEYATSVHGQRLAEFDDPNVAVCVSCHPAHQIRPPSDAESTVHPLKVAETCSECHDDGDRMASYEIPTDQRTAYERSVHWQWMTDEADLSAPTCNDCHGNHGAAPPGVSSVRNVCGQCHGVMAEYFSGGVHEGPFAERDLPGCATCHGNHEIVPIGDEQLLSLSDSICSQCHELDEPASGVFPAMKSLLDSLVGQLERSRNILLEAANAGMEVSEAQFQLEDVTTALVRSRTAVHTFEVDSVREQVNAGLAVAATAYARGEDALDEHLFRRQGLAVSVGLILVFVLGLAMKIRQLERAGPTPSHPTNQPDV